MENSAKLKVGVAIASLAAISIFFTAQYRRRRKQRCLQSSCYLQTDPKPQQTFKRVLADNSYSPFKHLKLKDCHNDNPKGLHPYKAEVTNLIVNPQVEFTNCMESEMGDSYVWVETEAQLKELVNVLTKERAFAVDTEQHHLRSFLGFTALIQISTQKEDYLVDTIKLHDVIGILRPVFADPNICKVFHGADNDVLWLQRDFHIYVVNLFDTGKACEVLSKPQKSLAYLLETYCGIATNKSLQREDWRQRPLSVEMVEYARMDAHFLLFIASCLISELKQHDSEKPYSPDDEFHFVHEASRRSNTICLQMYTKEIEATPGESAASSILSRHSNGNGCGSSISYPQFQDIVRRLCTWRDLMARVHDESLRYVLSDQAVVALADKIPTTSKEIYHTIAEADLNSDSFGFNSCSQSPSHVICSHYDDLYYLYENKMPNLDDIFSVVLQKHLGPSGSCPLTVFNYSLLVNCNLKRTYKVVSKQNSLQNSRKFARKASRQLFVEKFSCKSPVYHNCRIYANDGRLLCYCDRRKLEWYLRRDLAKLVEDNPPAIMLLFEPKGRPEDEDNDFYIQSKKNICVGCGEANHYLRYRIIPACYRVHFPEHLKSHRSHDIVLVCVDCHEVAHSAAEKYKKQIAEEFRIPLFIRKVVDSSQDQTVSDTNFEDAGVSPLELRSAAMALLRHGPSMPPKRRQELTETVMRYYGGREISREDLERALLIGMSPHERRRLAKKRGLFVREPTGSISPGKEQENNTSPVPKYALEYDSHAPKGRPSQIREDTERFIEMDRDADKAIDLGLDSKSYPIVHKKEDSDTNVADIKDSCLGNVDGSCGNQITVNGMEDLKYPSPQCNGTGSPQRISKLSLLGHGPHGKQVVEHILKESGDDGIGNFCQRWRQVFVDAINPHFLPGGWDVTHSGRRDFGEFSVFNPAKKASSTGKI